MARRINFEAVASIARSLPGVDVATAWGQPALKVRGKMFACIASHKSAEPNSLAVWMDFADRDALLADDPQSYYVTKHYLGHPCVLVRLSRVKPDALRDLLTGAHRFVSARGARKASAPKRARTQTTKRPASR